MVTSLRRRSACSPSARRSQARTTWPGTSGTLPNSMLIDKEGTLLRRYVGANEAQIEAMKGDIAAVIAGRPLGMMVMPTDEGIARGVPDKANK